MWTSSAELTVKNCEVDILPGGSRPDDVIGIVYEKTSGLMTVDGDFKLNVDTEVNLIGNAVGVAAYLNVDINFVNNSQITINISIDDNCIGIT